jgi:hypothetical protein
MKDSKATRGSSQAPVDVDACGETGIRYTCSDASIVALIHHTLAACVLKHDVWDIRAHSMSGTSYAEQPSRFDWNSG